MKNMRKKISVLAMLLTVPLLTQCASQDQVNQLEYQLRVVNKRLQKMETTTVDQIQKRQAASSGQMDQLQGEILNLKSQLEETGHLNRRLKEQNKDLESQFNNYTQIEAKKREEEIQRVQGEQRKKEQALHELNEKLRIQQENVKAIQQARVRDAERRAESAKKAAALARKKASAASSAGPTIYIKADKKKIKHKVRSTASSLSSEPASVTTTAKKTPTPQVQNSNSQSPFTRADSLYEKGDFKNAYPIYKKLVETSSDINQSTTARFMMGECLFNQQQYDQAILQYQKIISLNSGHEKAPLALLRQGQAFEKTKDVSVAKLIYQKLLSSYPTSSEATSAQDRLNKI